MVSTQKRMIITLLKGMMEDDDQVFSMTKMIRRKTCLIMIMMMGMFVTTTYAAGDTNNVYSPCLDAKVQTGDGFTFGIAFASNKQSFLQDNGGPQLSPCDRRLGLASNGASVAVFRPKVDEISLLTVNRNDTASGSGYMVAFAGQKYAARSLPIMFADNTHTITSFTLVLEFSGGTLQNLFWKSYGCNSCSGGGNICLNNTDCAVPNSKCQENGGSGCNIGIQLAFSGTDKNLDVLNSWYEVKNLRQYSLYTLYSNLRDTIVAPYEKFF
ncbi:uncharacterized protein LOC107476737 isoform X1 [Arachis duranensis]|uniref:Uncharacterized protein LOC107476737 isoform X1 n=1 Tax=Arachis duranensis TaxID=130453 RepID=A0A6P4CJP9_ARADU|nr:uncharacterized protein LOC107476737 isoform X1 [Arachis duranensis]